jgi:hypothetical protein
MASSENRFSPELQKSVDKAKAASVALDDVLSITLRAEEAYYAYLKPLRDTRHDFDGDAAYQKLKDAYRGSIGNKNRAVDACIKAIHETERAFAAEIGLSSLYDRLALQPISVLMRGPPREVHEVTGQKIAAAWVTGAWVKSPRVESSDDEETGESVYNIAKKETLLECERGIQLEAAAQFKLAILAQAAEEKG